MSRRKHRVIFQPMGARADVEDGTTLRSAARSIGVAIDSICGERATCGKCKVIVQNGEFTHDNLVSDIAHLSPPNAGEQAYWERRRKGLRAQGEDPDAFRLSCQACVHGDVVVRVPETSQAVQQVVRKSARARAVEVRPSLRKLYVELDEPSLDQPLADWERLKSALLRADPLTRGPQHLALDGETLSIDLPALRNLSRTLRDGQWRVTVTVYGDARGNCEVLRVEPDYQETLVGLAVDVGTTTIAAHLCDLRSGAVLATEAAMNPQVGYGEDIMSRMSYVAEDEQGLATLQTAVLKTIDRLARRAARQAGVRAADVMELVVVGNSTMHHLFLGLDTGALSRAPYVPTLHSDLHLRTRDVGLVSVNPGAVVHLLPITASFVGGDAMAVLLAEGPQQQDEHWLIVDVGTNAELVLGNREHLVCTSTPTGPAFEGAHVEYGIRATDGAIERVTIDPHTLTPRFKVIGSDIWSDEPSQNGESPLARGICGSGIIDAVAELYRVGLVDAGGQFRSDRHSPNLREDENGVYYVLAKADQTTIGREIPITQEDVRQIQLAKAPLYVAAHYLLHRFGLQRPDRILLAGGFGSHIDPLKAMLIGMIPDCPLDRVHAVGNAAGDGAWLALVNRDRRQEARDLFQRLERIELPAQPGFQDQFMLALHFPHMVDPYPHLQDIAPRREIDPLVARLYGDDIPTIGS